MRYFAFSMPVDEWRRWEAALPAPSYYRKLTSAEGMKIQIVYELKHRPTTAGDWYALDRLRHSYKNVISGATFNDHLVIDGNGWEATGEVFRALQLQVFPHDDRSYPAIIKWASSKKAFRRVSFIYAKRLKYEGMLTYPAIMAALYALNAKLPSMDRIKMRILERLTSDILVKSDQWDTKLSKEALRAVRSDLGRQRGEQLQGEKQDRVIQIKEAVNNGDFTKPNGEINKSKLADYLRVHRNTVSTLLPLAMAMMILILWIRPTYAFSPIFSISLGGSERGAAI